MEKAVFSEQYDLSPFNRATIDGGYLRIQQALIKRFKIPFVNIVGIYRYDLGFDTFILLIFFRDSRQKTKKLEPGLEQNSPLFIEALLDKAPKSANLLDMPKKEVLKKFGFRDWTILYYAVALLIVICVTAVTSSPQIRHCIFDKEELYTTIESVLRELWNQIRPFCRKINCVHFFTLL